MADNEEKIQPETANMLNNKIEKIHSFLYKEYIANLKKDYAVVQPSFETSFKREAVPHCFKVTRLVERLDKKEELLSDKFKNIFAAFNNTGATIALFAVKKEKIFDFYFFVKSKEIRFSGDDKNLLKDMLVSNFNGTEIIDYEPTGKFDYQEGGKKEEDANKLNLSEIFNENMGSVACVSAVATEKSEKFISQGLEKLFDSPTSEDFEILILAQSLTTNDVELSKTGYENLATEIAPFATRQESNGKSLADSLATTETDTDSHSHGTNESISHTFGGHVGVNIKVVNLGGDYHQTRTKGFSDTDTTSKSTGTTKSTIDTITNNTTLTYTDFQIKDSLEKIQEQIKRLDVGKSLGLWKTAAYIHSSEGSAVTKNIANIYKGLIQGEKSFIEPCVVTEWNDGDSTKETYQNILKYLKEFEHPVFAHIGDVKNEGQIACVTPAVFVNTSELAQQMCFPRKSVAGLPVLKCAEFAREIISLDKNESGESRTVNLGCVFHMHHEDKNLPVDLNVQNLASHTFITGSTGSGKSYTVYQLLSKLKDEYRQDSSSNTETDKIHFLIIEPAKGEYKNEFGNYADVVYGTNPNLKYYVNGDKEKTKKYPLLRINPFSFDGETHILEHLDRLIEIFNVCWPMYAAMPAVLKEAVEKSYEDCGWDLTASENKYDKNLFPNFADVTRNIRTIIDSSDYDAENKGAYKGSLITRLKSLTNGINGQIFSDDEIPLADLFDKNVIVDLSRVGSMETKSLIMGLLVLKLQEYRMNQGASKLKHVTVLEEAHNLLKRTSTEQVSESANLIGKSVEMLTNSIAEMRAFGEGFIIADQAPGLLDMAVIRNTNTKIILRLPDQSDRELVGRAANLNDEQITELAKLPCGVAAVYQNEWIEPVLCKVTKFESKGKFDKVLENQEKKKDLSAEQKLSIARLLLNGTALPDSVVNDLSNCNLSARSRAIIEECRKDSSKAPEFAVTSFVISEMFADSANALRKSIASTPDKQTWTNEVNQVILNTAQIKNDEQLRKDIDQAIITEVVLNELRRRDDFNAWYTGGYLK